MDGGSKVLSPIRGSVRLLVIYGFCGSRSRGVLGFMLRSFLHEKISIMGKYWA